MTCMFDFLPQASDNGAPPPIAPSPGECSELILECYRKGDGPELSSLSTLHERLKRIEAQCIFSSQRAPRKYPTRIAEIERLSVSIGLRATMRRLGTSTAQMPKTGALHNVLGRPIPDEDRRSFWKLVQLDLTFRLLHDQPPGGFEKGQDAIPAIHFLVRARMCFIVVDFFHLIDHSDGSYKGPEILAQTHGMCDKIDEMYSEWNILSFLLYPPFPYADPSRPQRVMDGSRGRTACTHQHGLHSSPATALVRRADRPEDVDAEVTDNPLIQKVFPRILKTTFLLLEKHSDMGAVSTFFNYLRIDLPYTYIARRLMQTPAHSRPKEDKMLLDSIAQVLEAVVQDIMDGIKTPRVGDLYAKLGALALRSRYVGFLGLA
ncbi:hypothetical protein ACJZ2D_010378 [Fusarium nematophilum]